MEKKLIYERIAAIMKDVGAIGKNQTNKQQGFKYRGIDDAYNALQPLLAKHEVFTLPEVLEERSEERASKSGGVLIYRILKIQYTFYTVDGSSVCCIVVGEGMDSGDKAANKAMAVGHKYALLQTFCIPTEDMPDPDAETHEVAPKKQTQKTEPESKGKGKELSSAQWKFICSIGKNRNLSEQECVKLIKFVAEREKIEPRHWKIAKLVLPEENFDKELEAYMDHMEAEQMVQEIADTPVDDIPFGD